MNSAKSTSPLLSVSNNEITRVDIGFSANSGIERNSSMLMDPIRVVLDINDY